jgi:hypothetical protein
MIDPAERLGLGSRTLRLWANLYRRGAFRASLPSGCWQAADELLRVARAADRSARDGLAKSLAISNRSFDPLADPLAIHFRGHRWLSSEREEAYSDWFGWILEQIDAAGRVLKMLGVRDRNLLRECASEKPIINREIKIPDGRPDLIVEFGKRLLVIVEIKTKSFDGVAVLDQLKRYTRWIQNRPQRTFCYFAAVEFGEFDCPAGFEPLPWRELTLRMREQAWEWVRASKKQPRNGSDLIRAAMTLAFCGAVEQNLLGLSGKPVMFRTRPSAEYLEEWSAKT